MNYKIAQTLLIVVFLIFLGFEVHADGLRLSSAHDAPLVYAQQEPEYVQSTSCQQCHQQQYADWESSHHAWAWRLPEPANVLGDFNDQAYVHDDIRYQFCGRFNQF